VVLDQAEPHLGGSEKMATKFLLGDEISAYLEEFSNKARDIRKLASELGRASDQNANIIQQNNLRKWIMDQHQVLTDKFIPYLTLQPPPAVPPPAKR
jgi:hypothetical protein